MQILRFDCHNNNNNNNNNKIRDNNSNSNNNNNNNLNEIYERLNDNLDLQLNNKK